MSHIEMTLSSSRLKLAKGTGAVTASVTNTAAKPQRIVLRAFGGRFVSPAKPGDGGVPAEAGKAPVRAPAGSHRAGLPLPDEPPDPTKWVTIDENLRSIAAGATEQYTVSFDSKDAPGGTYSVKLNAYSADEPPEANSGPVLSLELAVPAKPVEPKPNKFPWWIAAVAAVLVVAVAVVAFLLWPRKTEVPLLTGGTLEQAQQALAEANLGMKPDPVEAPDTPGTVLSQDPQAGEKVEPESIVTVGFAVEQTVEMPNVVGSPAGAARSGLLDTGLAVNFDGASNCTFNQPNCSVIGQLPEAGTRIPIGSTVLLTLGLDTLPTPTFTVPGNICEIIFCETLGPIDLDRFRLPDFGG
ncbi:PASTA domain-containing protein [Arthrobacter crystallopoietes BAB-32]|uniref:PASTA domain-containing protein n=1 Tax=Arthrobacter crystallopoietes BAB-32 TaxID=1246476 RepID=N1VC57_9MICC|nr:PASTA domain-containing protein [Arthrobacter crystallopoietes]EMY35863.1 PASTA domain-containing protein [Arthrobacter crystallopoietes BAB-32]